MSFIKTINLRVNFNLKDTSNVGCKKCQIWLSTTICGKRVRIFTKQLVKKEHWIKSERSEIGGGMALVNNTLGRVVNAENKAVNKELQKILGYCVEYAKLVDSDHLQTTGANALNHSPEIFKEYIEERIKGNDYLRRNDADQFIKDYISRKRTEVNNHTGRTLSNGTIYNHINAYKRLKQFTADNHTCITWDLFDRDFERKLTAWMNDRDYTPNTIASMFSIIKVWLTESERRGLIDDKSFHHYHTSTHDVDNIYLTEEEISRLYNTDVSGLEVNSQSMVEVARDLFVIGCLTGLRYSDYGSLPKSIDETTEMVRVRCHKTDQTVVIPLHPLVKEIYRKYNGRLPKPCDKGASLKNIRICAKAAGITTPVTLKHTSGGVTKDKTKPKYEFIMNHTARRSFATNMYLKKVPTASIMSVTGHTTESNFMKYIKVSGEEHAKIVAQAFSNN